MDATMNEIPIEMTGQTPIVHKVPQKPTNITRQPHICAPQFNRLATMIQATTSYSSKDSKIVQSTSFFEKDLLLHLYKPDKTLFISLPLFLERLLVLGVFDIKHLATAFSLTQRFVQSFRKTNIKIKLCAYRTFSVALLIAHKYLDDQQIWPIDLFSKICGIENYELILMEMKFLETISYRVAIPALVFIDTMNELYSIEPINSEKYSLLAFQVEKDDGALSLFL